MTRARALRRVSSLAVQALLLLTLPLTLTLTGCLDEDLLRECFEALR